MKTKLEKIKENPEATLIADELDKFSAIEAVYMSNGGKILFKSLMKDSIGSIESLMSKYKTLTHIEMIAICAELKSNIDLARVLKKSEKNKKQAQEDLEQALLEG